eukprot:11348954-Ditylum_brightwellii.AAC.1
MPSDMPIDAVVLGSWKIYMSELAISIKNKVLKTFEEPNVVIKGTHKLKKKISQELPCVMKETNPLLRIGNKIV